MVDNRSLTRLMIRITIMLVAFPAIFLALNTPVYLLALMLSRWLVNPGPTTMFVQRGMVVVVMALEIGGATYLCWLMWPKNDNKG